MLLVEQGVLCVLPMLWLVLLLSEAGRVAEAGCVLAVGPGAGLEGAGEKGERVSQAQKERLSLY